MASIKAFLSLEQTLADRLNEGWEKEAKESVAKLKGLIREGDEAQARRLVDQLSFHAVTNKIGGKLDMVATSALILGASRLVPVKRTVFNQSKSMPDVVQTAITGLKTSLETNGSQMVRDACHAFIDRAVPLFKSERIRLYKEADEELADALNGVVMGTGKGLVNVGANLTTSRLVSYGFLSQANEMELVEYQVSEVLDERICPVCQSMHGRTFTVERALSRLDTTLRLTDPSALKAANPWPKQDSSSMEDLLGMSDAEVQGRGWDAPPYHPMCRGVLVPTGTVERSQPDTTEQISSSVSPFEVVLTPEETDGEMGGLHVVTLDDLTEDMKKYGAGVLAAAKTYSAMGVERSGGSYVRSSFDQVGDDVASYVADYMSSPGVNAVVGTTVMSLSDLESMQPIVKKSMVAKFISNPYLATGGTDSIPVVVRVGGKNVIYDGDNRLQALKLVGVTHAMVKLVDLGTASVLKHDNIKSLLDLCQCRKCSTLTCD